MIAWWQIVIITLYAGYQILDELQIYSAMSSPVFAGLVAGLVMGDMKAGLLIGASTQLMVLGVGTFGVLLKSMQTRYLVSNCFLC